MTESSPQPTQLSHEEAQAAIEGLSNLSRLCGEFVDAVNLQSAFSQLELSAANEKIKEAALFIEAEGLIIATAHGITSDEDEAN